MKTAHVGLAYDYKNNVAVFQFAPTVDGLSCEILEYIGERETTASAAMVRLEAIKESVLEDLRARFPRKQFKDVVCIDVS